MGKMRKYENSLWQLDPILTSCFNGVVMPWAVQEYPPMESRHWWWWWSGAARWLKIWMDEMWSGTSDEVKLEVNGLEEGCIDLTLKWQLTAAEKGAVLKFDSNEMIGSQRSCRNLIDLTEEWTPSVSWERERERERERETETFWLNFC